MGQIFARSSNSVARATVLILFAGLFGFWGIVYAVYCSLYTPIVRVPLAHPAPFSHAHPGGGLGLDCRYCHSSVETASFAGIPSTEVCMTCHSQVWKDAPVLAPVRQSFASGRPIEWKRVN